jgi:hypothetical protein
MDLEREADGYSASLGRFVSGIIFCSNNRHYNMKRIPKFSSRFKRDKRSHSHTLFGCFGSTVCTRAIINPLELRGSVSKCILHKSSKVSRQNESSYSPEMESWIFTPSLSSNLMIEGIKRFSTKRKDDVSSYITCQFNL